MIHEFRSVINGLQRDARRQRGPDLLQFVFECPGDLVAVLAHQHEAQAEYRLAPAMGRHRAQSDFMSWFYVSDVPDANRHAVLGRDDDVANLLDVHGAPLSLDQEHPGTHADASPTYVAIILLDRLDHIGKGEAVLNESLWVDAHLVLFFIAAPTVDLGHSTDRPKLRFDDPIVNRP